MLISFEKFKLFTNDLEPLIPKLCKILPAVVVNMLRFTANGKIEIMCYVGSQRDGSVGKVLTTQIWRLEFEFSSTHV